MNQSILKKTLLLIVTTVVLISVGVIIYFTGTIRSLQDKQYRSRARELADIIAINIDTDTLIKYREKVRLAYDTSEIYISNDEMGSKKHEEYLKQYKYLEDTAEFKELYKTLRRMQDVTSVDCFYLCYLDVPTRSMVYMVDAGDDNICHPGSFDYLKGEDLKALEDPDRSIVLSVTDNSVYGDIVGSAEPIYDRQGNVIAYVGVDISMIQVTQKLNRLLLNTVLAVLVLALLLMAISLYISGQMMIRPIISHEELLKESEVLKKENDTLSKKALAAEKIAELSGSITSLLDNMPAMTFSKDVENGRYLACNQLFAEYAHKRTPSEVIGLSDAEIFDEETARFFVENDRIALNADRPLVINEEVRDAQGRTRHFKTTKLKFTDTSGRLCILGMSEDVTDLVKAQQENKKTRDAYNQAVSQSLTYSRIARALSSDYTFLYYVNTFYNTFVEYGSENGELDIMTKREGVDFFNQSLHDAVEAIYSEDYDMFVESFKKENILAAIEKEGRYLINYRLMIDDRPVYVSLKAVRLEDDEDHIIIGVSDVDAQMKERAAAERMKEEQATYQRIVALSGKYICIYTVDPVTEDFFEYTATSDYRSLVLPQKGADFFERSRKETERVIYEEDRSRVVSTLYKEKIIDEINRTGLFSIKYRLVIDGNPTYVNLRAAMIEETDGPKLIIGVIDIDARERLEQEYEKNLATAFAQANYDVMTGVKNKHAYVDLEQRINNRLGEGESVKFAIAVCDVNGLKKVNDTLGHKAGDDLIKNACAMISECFTGRQVFRIGGDEFAVIGVDDMADGMEEMVKSLVDLSVKNNKTGEPVIACGMSAAGDDDPDLGRVFERADKAMYENKKWLKSL